MSKIQTALKSSLFFRALSLISIKDRKKILYLSTLQCSLGILDLLGVASIGIITALAANTVRSLPPGDRITSVLDVLNLSAVPLKLQLFSIALLALFSLVGRTLLSIWLSRKILKFLSHITSDISINLISKLFNQPLLKIQERTLSETIYATTGGVNSIIMGQISTTIALIADFALLIVIFLGLLFLNPLIALSIALVFTCISYTIYLLQYKRASRISSEFTQQQIAIDSNLIQLLSAYRELIVRNRRSYFIEILSNKFKSTSNLQAEISFLPQINKYAIELTIVIGTFLFSAIQFITQDFSRAIATLAIFSAAAARLSPAVIRIQQSFLLLKSSHSSSIPSLNLINELEKNSETNMDPVEFNVVHNGFAGSVKISNVNFVYPGSENFAVYNFNLEIEPGEFVAIVGPSGAGKSTFADLVLGVLEPSSGEILISGYSPSIAIRKWSGAIAYVPQDSVRIKGSILDNIVLGFNINPDIEIHLKQAIEKAQLLDFISKAPNGWFTEIGERGVRISGGERQRVGIARALLTNPKLLILDEATSSLDSVNENLITSQLNQLKGMTTLIVIAHRISTLQKADKVVYISGGEIKSIGTFEEVRKAIPNFDESAKILGLHSQS